MIFTFKNLSYLRLHYTRNAQNPPKYGILIKFSRNLGSIVGYYMLAKKTCQHFFY